MMDLLEPRADDALSRSFRDAKPFRHLVIDNLLTSEFCRELADTFPGFRGDKAISELGTVGGEAVHTNLPELGGPYKRFDNLIRSAEFLTLVGHWTGIPNLLYDPEYVGGGTHENRHGQELDPHVDFNYHPTTALHRRLNLILFLNQEWDHHWGGILDFHSDPWDPDTDQVRSVAPAFNRCVLFETNEYSWHGFRRIVLPEDKRHMSRQTIAVYFYTRERPPEETAPDHSTVYVPRPMPPHIQPGHTLSEDDYSDLRTLYMRNTHQLKFLYDLLANRSDVPAEPDAQVETLLTECADQGAKRQTRRTDRDLQKDSRGGRGFTELPHRTLAHMAVAGVTRLRAGLLKSNTLIRRAETRFRGRSGPPPPAATRLASPREMG